MPVPRTIVCMAVGEPHADTDAWIVRLLGMLERQLREPFRLVCYRDRRRDLPAGVEQLDCSAWTELERPGMRPTTRKLGLFHPAYTPFDEFLYLDLSLVVRRPLDDLLAFVDARPEPLVIVPNWHYDGYNSSVMRIRRGPLAAVYAAFVAGERYPQRVAGDQDFLHAAVRAHGLADRVATLPDGMVVSFRKSKDLAKRQPEVVRRRLAAATIVKFHGPPKMDVAFSLAYRIDARLGELSRRQWRPAMPLGALRREWLGPPPGAT